MEEPVLLMVSHLLVYESQQSMMRFSKIGLDFVDIWTVYFP